MLKNTSPLEELESHIDIQESGNKIDGVKKGQNPKDYASSTERSNTNYYEYSDISLNSENIFGSNRPVFNSSTESAVENSYGTNVRTALPSATVTEYSQLSRAKCAFVISPELTKAAVCLSPNGDQWPSIVNTRIDPTENSQASENKYGSESLRERAVFNHRDQFDSATPKSPNNGRQPCSENIEQNVTKDEPKSVPKQSKDLVQKSCLRTTMNSLRRSPKSLPSKSRPRKTTAASSHSMHNSLEPEVAKRQLNESLPQQGSHQKPDEEFQEVWQLKSTVGINVESERDLAREKERRRKECFQAWLQQKEAQRNWEKILKEREIEEKKNSRTTRSREASEQAFKEWLRRKNLAAKNSAKVGRENLKLHEQRQRSAAIIRAIQKINLNNFFLESRFYY